jgi:hypothetical protein
VLEKQRPVRWAHVDIELVRPLVSIATLCDARYFWGARLQDYEAGELEGRVPRHVLERWRCDVASLERPRHEHTCVANAFVLHRSRLDFIDRWRRQLEWVLDPAATGLLAHDNRPYRMTDESVMSSLLAFDVAAPTLAHSLDPHYARQHQVVVRLDAHYRRVRSAYRGAAGQVRRRLRKSWRR